jgi:hypothetical protein
MQYYRINKSIIKNPYQYNKARANFVQDRIDFYTLILGETKESRTLRIATKMIILAN